MTDFFKEDMPDDGDEYIKSKTQIKREMEALQALGKRLMALKPDISAKAPISDVLHAALRESRRITQNEASRRHLQYIGKLMRDEDEAAVTAFVERYEIGAAANAQHFHKLEIWRDRLISDDKALAKFMSEYTAADRQRLRQLIRNARKEAEQNKAPASSRKLFKYIRELAEEI